MFSKRAPSILRGLTVLAVALSVHGLLLLNDGVYWDGWLLYALLRDGQWAVLQYWYKTLGLPIGAYFHWVFSFSGDIIATYRIVAFVSLLGIAATAYALAGRVLAFTTKERLLVAIVVLTFPGYQNAVDMVTVLYLFCLLVFLVAWLVALRAICHQDTFGFLYRALSLILFFLSFTFNSLLVFYFAAFVSFIAVSWRHMTLVAPTAGRVWRASYVTWRNLDYLLLPPIYWVTKEIFSPRVELYANYNRFNLDWGSLVYHTEAFISNGLYYPLIDALRLVLHSPWLFLCAVAVSLWLTAKHGDGPSWR